MGMFDYIRCEVPLPDGWNPHELQSKDFNCEMVTHTITKEGRLMLERVDDVLEVPKAERPYPDAADDDFRSICGSLHYVKSRHDANFHGVVNFYGSEYQTPDDEPAQPNGVCHGPEGVSEWKTGKPLKHVWHKYNAKFTDGQLVSIEAVQD